ALGIEVGRRKERQPRRREGRPHRGLPRRLFLFGFARRTTPMLVVSRKPGEKTHVGPGVTITVVQAQGKRVRLGIDAPAEVPPARADRPGGPGGAVAAPTLPGPGRPAAKGPAVRSDQ